MKSEKWSKLKQVFILYLFITAVWGWIRTVEQVEGDFSTILTHLLKRVIAFDLLFILYAVGYVLIDNMKYKPVKKYAIGYFICGAIFHGYYGTLAMLSWTLWRPGWESLYSFSLMYIIFVVAHLIKEFFSKRKSEKQQ